MSTQQEPTEEAVVVIQAEAEQALSYMDRKLREQFAADVAGQIDRMDALARQLIVLQLAIPGIYAAMLKLISGDKAMIDNPLLLALAFIIWFAALGFTLSSIMPQKQQVDPGSLSEIQHYFTSNAQRKWKCLMIASIATLIGIALAITAMFIHG